MVVRFQSSMGRSLKRVDSDDLNVKGLVLATVSKINYKYQSVEVKVNNLTLGSRIGDDGSLAVPYPKSFIGRTPEGSVFGTKPLITEGSVVLIGFLNDDINSPIILSVYGDNEQNKMINTNPLDGGKFDTDSVYKYSSALYEILPSLNYKYDDGEGTSIKTFNGKSFFSMTSGEEEKPQATDFYTGTEYQDLFTSYYGNKTLIEPRIQKAPNMLFKHQGVFYDDGTPDNHITTLFISERGDIRASVLNTETQKRTTQEMSSDGSYRVIKQDDDLMLDEAQVWIEYGISEDNKFYIKNDKHKFEFTDEGIYIDDKPMLENLGDSIEDAMKNLQDVQEQLEDINYLLEGVGKDNLEELIKSTKESIEASNQATKDVQTLRTDISAVSSRTEGIITQFQDFRDRTFRDFYDEVNEYLSGERGSIESIVNTDLPAIRNTEQKYRQTTFRDIKIHADLPFKFKDYDSTVATDKVTYYFPQGIAIHNGQTYIIHSAPESGTKRLIVVYDEFYKHVNMFYAGTTGGEGLHVETEGTKTFLYARTSNNNIGKFDVTNPRSIVEKSTLQPVEEYNINAYMNFFRTESGWGVEYNNQTKGVFLQRDTVVFFNKDFSKKTGYLWINPANSTLWSSNLLGSVTNHSAKKQGMTLINNTIVQTLGGNWNPTRDTEIHTYHLQGVQEISPSGDIMNDYTYHPYELRDYLTKQGKTVDMLEHEGAFSYNNRLFSVIVYKSRTKVDADKQGVLIVEYKPKEKEYTFNKTGEPFLAPTANYNPYKTNIDGKFYNEYTGEEITSIKDLIRYMVATYQSNIVFYSSKVSLKGYDDVEIPTGLRVELENLNNYTFHLLYRGNVTEEFYIINYTASTDSFNITAQDSDNKYDKLDLSTIKTKLTGYVTNATNTPTSAKHGYIDSRRYGSNSKLFFSPYNSYETYMNLNLGGVWQGWEKTGSNTDSINPVVVSKEEPAEAVIWFEVTD